MSIDRYYVLSSDARVRPEAFGLLFYDTRQSRLTFVRCGMGLEIQTAPGGTKRIAVRSEASFDIRIERLIAYLQEKGLIGKT